MPLKLSHVEFSVYPPFTIFVWVSVPFRFSVHGLEVYQIDPWLGKADWRNVCRVSRC